MLLIFPEGLLFAVSSWDGFDIAYSCSEMWGPVKWNDI